jgi:hypothetical protein
MLYTARAGDVRHRWRAVYYGECWQRLPGDDDVIRRARIREVSQAVFTASQLGALIGYIRRPVSTEFSVSQLVSIGRSVKRRVSARV